MCHIGVSHPALDSICDISARHGFVSKLTGAGGGGCAYTLLPQGTHWQSVKMLYFSPNFSIYFSKCALLGYLGEKNIKFPMIFSSA